MIINIKDKTRQRLKVGFFLGLIFFIFIVGGQLLLEKKSSLSLDKKEVVQSLGEPIDNDLNLNQEVGPVIDLVSIVRQGGQAITKVINKQEAVPDKEEVPELSQASPKTPQSIHVNLAVDYFSNSYFINNEVTNLFFDYYSTALTFKPRYELDYLKACDESFCGFLKSSDESCLSGKCVRADGDKVYFNNKEIVLPAELAQLNILKIGLHPLETKWLASFLVSVDGQDQVYLYFLDNGRFSSVINSGNNWKIRTTYGRGNGHLSAVGSDQQFLFIYSGYEGLGVLYNNGNLQLLKDYFSLRLASSGFPARIIRIGSGNEATWYVCSLNPDNTKLIKFWQNGTDTIQGAIDLSFAIPSQSICGQLGDDLQIATQEGLSIFKDLGFDNSQNYQYQSINLNSFSGKKIFKIILNRPHISADPEKYQIYLSVDGTNWEKVKDSLKFSFEPISEGVYLRVIFLPGDQNYSPWFSDIGIIHYQATD